MILSHYYQIYCKFSSQCKFYWALFSLTEIMAGGSRALEEMHLPKPTSVHTRWHSGLMESKPCTASCLWMSWVLCSMSRSSSELKGPPALGSTAADSPQFLALCCIASTGGVLPLPRQRSVTQLCPTLCDPMDHSPPSSSAHGIFQARVLEWGAIAFSLEKARNTKCVQSLTYYSFSSLNCNQSHIWQEGYWHGWRYKIFLD